MNRRALVPGRLVGMRGNARNAVGRPVRHVAERVVGHHRHSRAKGEVQNGAGPTDAILDQEFTEQHPTLVAAITDYLSPGRTVDDLFRECLDVVIAGAAVKTTP